MEMHFSANNAEAYFKMEEIRLIKESPRHSKRNSIFTFAPDWRRCRAPGCCAEGPGFDPAQEKLCVAINHDCPMISRGYTAYISLVNNVIYL